MKIYSLIDQTNNISAITASIEVAINELSYLRKKGHVCAVFEGELKTQGKNFNSWAIGWKQIELPF